MSAVNPHPDPTEGKFGNVLEILESLSVPELEAYIAHLRWEQANGSFSGTSPYTSASYHRYRTEGWIQTCRELIAAKRGLTQEPHGA